jgi:2',3'-cyclic-nucleotide 2'-phosphodiesterase (5'-nucleotidase family)
MSLSTTPNGALIINPLASLNLVGAEIAGFDAASKRLFVTSNGGLQVVDLTNPATPVLVGTINLTAAPYGFATTDVTSVAVKNGVVAVALPNADKTLPGQVVFLNAADGALLGAVTVGALPDNIVFSPDGTKVLTANEAEFTTAGPGAKGSVSIIDIAGGIAAASVQTAGFTAFDGQEAALRAAGVRIFGTNSVSDDVEPEYIAVSPDGTKALVTLQEANAVGLLDIATATFTAIVPLGAKDFSALLADFSDRDSATGGVLTNLTTGNPVFGLYMPDAIAAYEAAGQTFYVTANEGDDRDDFLNPDETIRLGNAAYDLDDALFPNEAALKANAALGRLVVSNAPGLRGDTDGDGDVDQILAYGARSFSILDATGAIVFDSADIVERIAAGLLPAATFDDRSDNKGPEPEGVTVGVIDGRTYAFVGLERAHVTLAFDVTDPGAVEYAGLAQRAGDLNPEGGLFIPAAESPTGLALFVSTNEASNNVSVFSVATPAPFTLQLLHFADAEAGLLAGSTAPYLAALVDAFDDDFANTLILAGGDNYIPGPFLAAGTDPSVQAVHGRGDNPAAADIEIHNRIGVQASTIGNHEFDLGTRAFSDAIADANFPYLSANLDFSADTDISGRYLETVGVTGLEDLATLARRIVPSAVANYGGEKIGLVGATTQIVETISSTGRVEVKGFAGDGAETNDMALLAAQLQVVINDLLGQGVNKIILMAHLQQIAFETALAPLLSGVDVILAAGSNTRLGDANDLPVAFPGHAANFANTYPIVATGTDGGTTLIVNTDNEYTYLGRLVLTFDTEGRIIPTSLDPAINGAYAATAANVAAAWGVDEADLATTAFAEGTKGDQVADITEAVEAVILAKDGQVWGFTDVYLEGERNLVRNQETNLGNITADANKAAGEEALGDGSLVASLKNGGGIRAPVGATAVGSGEKLPPIANPAAGKPAGAISQLDIENALRFDNKLMVFDTTAAGLKAILEHGVANLGNQGRFPQLGGVAFSYDPDFAAGARIQSIGLVDETGKVIARLVENGAVSAEAPALVRLVTLSFLAQGGDGYPMKANGENFRFLLTDGTLSGVIAETQDFTTATAAASVGVTLDQVLGEQRAFAEYLEANHATPAEAFDVAETPAAADARIQNLNVRADAVLDGETIIGTNAAETTEGSAGADSIAGNAGDDVIPAGAGADTVDAGAGNDSVDGGSGDDSLTGGNGGDTLDGGLGADTLAGGTGGDLYLVDDAGDAVTEAARAGFDTVMSSIAATVLGANIEALVLLDGAVSGTGNAAANRLTGNAGDNTLAGLGGADTLIGGEGADVFLFTASSDSHPQNPTRRDVIEGFVRGEDKLHLDFDANVHRAGDQDFVFVTGPFVDRQAGVVRVEGAGPDAVLVLASVNGNTAAEFGVLVRGVTTLDASDFILA